MVRMRTHKKASASVYVFAACSQDGMCVNENQNTGPESSLEKLLHELEKCNWITTETQKMRSKKCRAGPSGPQAARNGSPLRKVQTSTQGKAALSPAGL